MMVRKRLWLQVVWGTIATIALSSCAKTLGASKIEEIIKADLNKQSGLSVKSITCPMGIKSEPGKTFECIGELDPDGGFFITVKQEDEQGRVSWEVPNSWRLLNLTQLEAEFKQKLMAKSQLEPKVDCGGGYRATKPGDSFECKLVQQPQQRKQPQESNPQQSKLQTKLQKKASFQSDTIVVRVEPEGNVTWQEVRVLAAQPLISAGADKASNSSARTQTSPSINLPPEVGIKDNTGWTQLSD